MRNTLLLVIFLSFMALGLGLWLFRRNEGLLEARVGVLRVGDVEVSVEIADSPEMRSRGLSGRERLREEEGMLFMFPDSQRRSFWMRQMRFPLDIMFISGGRVNEIFPDVPAPADGQDGTEIRVQSQYPADWVLEVNSGWAERNRIEIGDRVALE